jgi:hypothetical protein
MIGDPKPAKRIVMPSRVRAKVLVEGRCRICGRTGPLNGHHLVPRSQGGDDVWENIVPLCGSGVMGCHGMIEERAAGWRSRLRAELTLDEVRYVTAKKSWAWLADHYPEEAA